MSALRLRGKVAVSRHTALLAVFALVLMSVVIVLAAETARAEVPDGQPPPGVMARLVAAAAIQRADTPQDQPQPNTPQTEQQNPPTTPTETQPADTLVVQAQTSDSTPNQDDDPDIQGAPADGEVAAEIVNRPEGDNVVSITPNGDRITIKDSNNGETQSDAPLWQDNPNKDEPGADPGSQNIGDTTGDEDVMVVLNRPTTTTDDGEEHTKQWDAWYATYYELVALGNDFIECETGDHVPGGEECWVVDVSLVSETLEEEEEADSDDGGQGSTPSALPLTPEQRWPGRNYQWTDPGPVDEPGTDQTPPVDEPDTDQTPPVDEPGSGEDANPLTTIGQNPEDGSEITIVNIPSSTNDPEQRKRNFDLENEALDALDEAGEPYVVCFGDETYTDMHTGDTVTIPAFCNVIDPSV